MPIEYELKITEECDFCGVPNEKLYYDKRTGENLCGKCRGLNSYKINKRSKEEDE